MNRLPFLYISESPGRGRGVFTAADIPAGSAIECCPVIVLSEEDTRRVHETHLHDYYFLWGDDGRSAIALGFGSLYNHAEQANADYKMDFEALTIDVFALSDIPAGAEITINYMDGGEQASELWFETR